MDTPTRLVLEQGLNTIQIGLDKLSTDVVAAEAALESVRAELDALT